MTIIQDFSGYGYNGVVDGAPESGPDRLPAAAGTGVRSTEVYYGATISIPHPLLDADNRIRGEYTYEAWVYAFGTPQEVQIYGMADEGTTTYLDGLTIEGTVVRWTVMYDNEDPTVLEYDFKIPQRVHLVGTHSNDKDQLWVNGVMVAESSVTDAQRADTKFAHTHNVAVIGKTITATANQRINFSGLSLYAKVLPAEVIERHWLMSNNQNSSDAIVNGWGGEKFDTYASGTEVFMDFTWTNTDDWKLGHMNGIRIFNDELRPEYLDGVSVGGQWIRTIVLDEAGTDAISGVNFDWDGDGVTIEVSLDGSTWEAVEQGVNVGLIASGFDPTDEVLYLRATFDDGDTDDSQYLDNIRVMGTRTQTKILFGRTFLAEGHRGRNFEPLEQNALWGTILDTGDVVSLSADVDSEPSDCLAVEVWMKDVNGDWPVFNAAGTADSVEVNGSSAYGIADLLEGHWWRVVYHFNTSYDDEIIFTGPGQIGYIALYSTDQTSSTQYLAYVGETSSRHVDTSTLAMSENADKIIAYSGDWTIQAS